MFDLLSMIFARITEHTSGKVAIIGFLLFIFFLTISYWTK